MITKNTVRLYNTLSREVEDFVPLEDSKVRLYACGPTVYDYAHLGHIRKYVFDDVLVRMLRYLNYKVNHVMNVTDVGHLVSDADTGEDKLEKGAKREGKTAWEVAKFYEAHFFRTMDAVLVIRPDVVCRATEHIPEMLALIQKLVSLGFTYQISDGIYFDISRFPEYGKLAGFDKHQKQVSRIEEIPGKKHPADFALWKFTPSGTRRDMEWDSPWGKGFPGWHIECSAMSMKYLGETFDIHTAGIDHIPVHSPNEIAQSEAASGKPFVKYWIHHNFLLINGTKMSKSLGNYYTLDDVTNHNFDPVALRYLFLQTHYRQEANFTWDALSSAEAALKSLRDQFRVIREQKDQGERSTLSDEKLEKVNLLRKHFKDTIRMDLNTAQALGAMWEIVKSNVPPGDKYDLLLICDEILGLGLANLSNDQFPVDEIPAEIMQLVSARENFRKQKSYDQADKVRKQIEEKGYLVEDLPTGPRVKKKGILTKSQNSTLSEPNEVG